MRLLAASRCGRAATLGLALPPAPIAFDQNVERDPSFGIGILPNKKIGQRLARFRKSNVDNPAADHDALEFPDGQAGPVTRLCAGQRATVSWMTRRWCRN